MNYDGKRSEKVSQAVENFGLAVKKFRQENFLSLSDFAELSQCSTSYLWRIENHERNPDYDVRIRILTQAMRWSTEDIQLYLEETISKGKLENKN